MSDIRYVCLSDMHLGADNSVLTNIQANSIETDTLEACPVLIQLVACLRELIAHNEGRDKPILVLNGDIIEMALSETNKAAMVFERFIELIFPPDGEPLFDKQILYIPGNHDHHIWESARETQYVNFLCRTPVGAQIDAPWHATKMFAPDPVREHFLTNLIQRYPHLKDAVVNVIYPNYALLSDNGQRCVIFNHGHYIEPLYSLMSTLNTMIFPDRATPKVVWDLEAENFAWIDFFWSTMGRSGDVGRDIGLLYDKLQDERQVEKLITHFSASLVQKYSHMTWAEGIETKGLAWILNCTLGRVAALERRQLGQVLSPNAQLGLRAYLEGPLLAQIRIENRQNMPQDVTFLFGHTHKPFQQDMTFTGYPQWVKVYNSGGWVVDTVQVSPNHGAAILLIDETLQVTSLRMYNQAADAGEYAVRVEETAHAGSTSSPFHTRIRAIVQPCSEPWRTFSETVAQAVTAHAGVLQTKIDL